MAVIGTPRGEGEREDVIEDVVKGELEKVEVGGV
jgi:hypothetical protein